MKLLIQRRWPFFAAIYGCNLILLLTLALFSILPSNLIVTICCLFSLVCFRLVLWISPLLLTTAVWIPATVKTTVPQRLLLNLAVLGLQFLFSAGWYLLSGSFY